MQYDMKQQNQPLKDHVQPLEKSKMSRTCLACKKGPLSLEKYLSSRKGAPDFGH